MMDVDDLFHNGFPLLVLDEGPEKSCFKGPSVDCSVSSFLFRRQEEIPAAGESVVCFLLASF